MTIINKQTIINRDSARITGIQKHYAQQASIQVAGVAYTPAAAVQIYQNDLDALAAVAQARSALKAALARARATGSAADSFDSVFKHCIEGAFTGQPDTLDDFGLAIAVRSTPSAQVKAAAAVKMAATRKARGIMSKKQRAQIKAPTPGEVVANAAPAPAPAAASAAVVTKQ